MNITLLTVGRTDIPWVRESLGIYVSRLSHYVPFKVVEIPSIRASSSFRPAQFKEKEGELILKALKASDEVILLDERGREYRSVEFAALLEERMARSARDLVFVIGGAYGFSEAVYARADGRMALSRMTFPHQMVRTVFAEPLYRAFTILRREPYHNE